MNIYLCLGLSGVLSYFRDKCLGITAVECIVILLFLFNFRSVFRFTVHQDKWTDITSQHGIL